MNIGIAGLGFVGDALKYGLEYFGIHDIKTYDPKISGSRMSDISACDIIFVCVPTPMGKGGCIDDSIVDSVLAELQDLGSKGTVVIKSTLLPTSVSKFIKKYHSLKIVTNPEFLTERRARRDFINSEWVIIGASSEEHGRPLHNLYKQIFTGIPFITVSPEAAMMVKYMTNVWFAVKVSLMNEYHDAWNKMQESGMVSGTWDSIVDAFGLDTRVGTTHLQVPGPDGHRGWGGKCFPKDLNALMSLFAELGCTNDVMRAAWNDNKKFRTNKDWLVIDGAVSSTYEED